MTNNAAPAQSLFIGNCQLLNGMRVLLTAGPTHEALDPVRYLTNYSSGKMGYALAEVLAEVGAAVTLVSGPTHLSAIHPAIEVVPVDTAQQMHDACMRFFSCATITILTAAVADYTPRIVAEHKIKKKRNKFMLELVKTIDISSVLGNQKKDDQLVIGFALETDHELENARKKLKSKNLDLIVMNSLNDVGSGFGHDTNQVTLLYPDGAIHRFGLKSKRTVAIDIIHQISTMLLDRQNDCK